MPISNKALIDSLIQGIQLKDQKLYEILRMMSDNFGVLLEDLQPLIDAAPIITGTEPPPEPVFSTNYVVTPSGIRLSWIPVDETVIALYDLREGVNWATATRITKTPDLEVFLGPQALGMHPYLLKTINRSGTESLTATPINVLVSDFGSISISSNVIDNNVLLTWVAPTSAFAISHYIVSRNNILFGVINSTFTVIFEQVPGTITYGVKAVDIFGNESAEVQISVVVNQPPDYVLIDSITSSWGGTKTNCIVDGSQLFCCIDTAKTWATHFSSEGFNTIQDQINAGYPYFYEPTLISGSYAEVFDFGSILNNILINIDWDYIDIDDGVVISPQIEYSTDGSSWSTPVSGVAAFALSVRYVRVTLNFSGARTAFSALSNLRVMLDVKLETDSGRIEALASDTNGTLVTFNKTYRDINSITLSANSLEPVYPVYDFVDVPNPTSFKVMVFDSAGNRITYWITWKARGIV